MNSKSFFHPQECLRKVGLFLIMTEGMYPLETNDAVPGVAICSSLIQWCLGAHCTCLSGFLITWPVVYGVQLLKNEKRAPQGTTSLARYSRLQDPEASLCQCDPQSHQLSCFRPEWWLGHWTLALDVQGLCDAASLRCCCAPYSVSLLKVKEVSCLVSLSCVLWIPMTVQTWKPLQWSWKY